jgi:predicted MFS family arabinose efflux permease
VRRYLFTIINHLLICNKQEVLDLLQYLNVNVVALRKILKQHDKHFRLHMSSLYFEARIGSSSTKQSSQLLQLYHQEGLRAIIETLYRGFEGLYALKTALHERQLASVGLEASEFRSAESLLQANKETANVLLGRTQDLAKSVPQKTFLSRVRSFNLLSSLLSSSTTESSIKGPGSAKLRADITPVRPPSNNNMEDAGPTDLSTQEPILALLLLAADKVLEIQQQTTEEYTVMHSEMGPWLQMSNILAANNADSSEGPDGYGNYRNIEEEFDVLGDLIEAEVDIAADDISDIGESNMRMKPSMLLPATSYNDLLSLVAASNEFEDSKPRLSGDSYYRDKYSPSATHDPTSSSMSTYDLALRAIRKHTKQQHAQSLTEQQKKQQQKRIVAVNLYITLAVSFLYQANQYVISPTSGLYAAKLGMSPSLSAAIVGTSPLAAVVSAVYYSYISNFSFKRPLVMSVFCLCAGNIAYASALPLNSPICLFLGRLLCGLGGPRALVRRYIADHIPRHQRNRASSMFVNSGCLGLAVGPLLSALLLETSQSRWLNFRLCSRGSVLDRHLTFYTGISSDEGGSACLLLFEEVTAPGWIMAMLFALCLLCTCMSFTEPQTTAHTNLRRIQTTGAPLVYVSCYQRWLETGVKIVDTLRRCFRRTKGSNRGDEICSGRAYSYGSVVSPEKVGLRTDVRRGEYQLVVSSANEWLDNYEDARQMKTTTKDKTGGSTNNITCSADVENDYDNRIRADSVEFGQFASLGPTQTQSSKHADSVGAYVPALHTLDYVDEPDDRADGTSQCVNWCTCCSVCWKALSGHSLSGRPYPPSPGNCWFKHLTQNVIVILLIYFFNKIGQEVIVSSVPTIGTQMFGWTQQVNGLFMCLLGVVVLPTTYVVNNMTKESDDRTVVWGLSLASVVW